MDVVPAFVAVDGVKFPLVVDGGHVRLADDPRFPGLGALSYVAGHLIARPAGDRTAELSRRADLVEPQALFAAVVSADNRDDLGDGVANWTRLAGYPPDLDDAYVVGTTWLAAGIVVPRRTLIRLIEEVGGLHDAVLAHQLEPRLAGAPEAGPVNPLPATRDDTDDDEQVNDRGDDGYGDNDPGAGHAVSASGAAANGPDGPDGPDGDDAPRFAGDDLLRSIDAVAGQVDELDAAARRTAEPYADAARNAAAAARRHRLFLELAAAGLLAPALAGQLRAALTRLGLTRLLGYHDAIQLLARYLASADRAGRFPGEPVPRVPTAQVSLDWFRTPSGYRPEGVTEHEWLALCERNFASPLPASPAGSRFVRLCGAMHQLRYRAEVGAAPCLWRVEPAEPAATAGGGEGTLTP